ncbi:MAG: preprotein translocase subunit YajC [Candidatus Omnitrophota bacterium]
MIDYMFFAMAGSPQGQESAGLMSFLPIIVIFVIFYLLLIKPQQKKQKEQQQLIATLQKNDEVITAGGIHGTIAAVKDKTFILRIDENVRIEIEKSSVSRVTKVKSLPELEGSGK